MVSTVDKWVRIFDVPEFSKHKKGFTIYKIVSMLYPETCPDAITKVTVWKRFNDVKNLHREIKVLHRKHNLKDKFPNLGTSTFFKRFDERTIKERQQNILSFLDYVGSHPNLFSSNEFVKFFETSHTPLENLIGNICAIRADLNLPEDPEYISNYSDDERTISDTDSVTTLSSLSPSVQISDALVETASVTSIPKLKKMNSNTSTTSRQSDSASIATNTDSMTLLDGQLYPTPPNTPGSVDEYIQYIIDASVHINIASELERDKKYNEAYAAYKTAVDILIKYGKEDTNYERKQMIKYKTEKYLLRAEKIYNMYLAPEVQNITKVNEELEDYITQRPISDLYKYKVVRVIGNGMLVLHEELQLLFYVKVLHKTTKFLDENLILPENVPYMIKLKNYYSCENALFLILEYCCALSVWDYLKHQSENSEDIFNKKECFLHRINSVEFVDSDSEPSYGDLINEYRNNKSSDNNDSQKGTNLDLSSSSESNLEASLESIERSIDSSTEPLKLDNEGDKRRICERSASPHQESQNDATFLENIETKTGKRLPVASKLDKSSGTRDFETRPRISRTSTLSSVDIDEDLMISFIPSIENVTKWAAQLLLALEKLHCLGVICRDLQSKNLLINETGDLVLTYMCNLSDIHDIFTSGESRFLAPEIYNFESVTEAVDWWSYGAILYELLVGLPLSVLHPDGLNSYSCLKIPKFVSPEGRSLLKQLLVYEPSKRLGYGLDGVENLKSHPFFSSVDWEVLLAKGR